MIAKLSMVVALFFTLGIGVNAGSTRISQEATIQAQTADWNQYYAGWQAGWSQGWKQVKGQYSIAPVAPVPPTPKPGKMNYTGGYNAGFLAGINKANNS